FADISGFEVICEVAESSAGYNPELSYGSHIFQDLVEADILYTAVFEDSRTKGYHPEKLMRMPDLLGTMFPEAEEMRSVVRICDVSGGDCRVFYDLKKGELAVTV
ncbi:MAG: hypothetical protein J6E44_05170, partial [Lachnospiraceae bacterium]|nr:hypothetical protein [Lachnospiraceae bacterium]